MVLVIVSLVLSLTASVYLYTLRIKEEIRPRLLDVLATTQAQFNTIKEKSTIYADLIKDNPIIVGYLKGAIERDRFIDELVNLSGKTDLDFLQVINLDGIVEGQMENISQSGNQKGADPLVVKALEGRKLADFSFDNDELSLVSATPIKDRGRILGVLLAGYYANNNLLKSFQSLVDEDFAIAVNDQISASTFKTLNLNRELLSNIRRGFKKEAVYAEAIKIAGQDYYLAAGPIRTEDNKTFGIFIIATNLDGVNRANVRTLWVLTRSAALTFLFSLLLSAKISKTLSQPLLAIQDGARIIGAGNLNHKITLNTGDEFTDLSHGFNKMAASLKTSMQQIKNERDSVSAERNKLSLILSGIADGVLALDLNYKVILFSQGAERLTGLAAKDVRGKHLDQVLQVFRPLGQKIEVNEFCPARQKSLKKDLVLFQEKGLQFRVTGYSKEFYANMMSAAIKESKIINLGCIITLHDTTAEHDLEQMKLDFVSMAAHELRTPLTAIAGYLYYLDEELKGKITTDQKTYLERITISTKQLQSLVENLLDATRIERGTLSLELKEESWEKIVSGVVETFNDFAKQKSLTLKYDKPLTPLPHVNVDRFRISEVISNLLSNAVNFTPPKGTVTIRVFLKENNLVTEISDTGIGIPADSLAHLFTKFYRVSGVLSEGSKGTGLGLFISKAIVELHQGKIWVESSWGKGSSFYFSLPALLPKQRTQVK